VNEILKDAATYYGKEYVDFLINFMKEDKGIEKPVGVKQVLSCK